VLAEIVAARYDLGYGAVVKAMHVSKWGVLSRQRSTSAVPTKTEGLLGG
jgi:hypothetical protein